MSVIRRTVSATTSDALNGLKFKVQNRPALVTLAASAAAAGETLSFSVGSREIVVDAVVNLESADRVVDPQRDVIMAQERVPPGEYFLPMTLAGADVTYWLNIEPLPGG